ncbi:uroporphyrinogen-III synthase [Metabacillus herbersteinensis]|uniref:Uroporphyrinogen-III synthase n=1 Tax=Metabacillus herbersteinensis TaxID=283816 RepID=A0ABV6GGC0_9BACI
MEKLAGKKVALLGPRRAEELSVLVKNLGGIPLLRPAQGTVYVDDSNVESEINNLVEGKYDWLLFTTGIGLTRLHETASKMGIEAKFLTALQTSKVAARGYKTINALKKLDVKPHARDDDGSTLGLIRGLEAFDLRSCKVALQLHGDPAPHLIEFLQSQGADYHEILPYQHIPPQPEVMEQLVAEILQGEVDAVNFTSRPQPRFLFAYAREKGLLDEVLQAFSEKVIAVSVGKVTAQALKEEGVTRIVIPENERMGSAIMELVKYYEMEENI